MAASERKPKSSPPLQICLFDVRRGDKEGEEAEKVLGYYPATVSHDAQASIVGLAQAALAFASTFKPVSWRDQISMI